jgi:uncharacterized protein
MVEAAEDMLQGMGFSGCRVRHHGEVARIELAPRDLRRAMQPARRAEVLKGLKGIGFKHIAIDLEGYVQGSLNRALAGKSNERPGAQGVNDRQPAGRTATP